VCVLVLVRVGFVCVCVSLVSVCAASKSIFRETIRPLFAHRCAHTYARTIVQILFLLLTLNSKLWERTLQSGKISNLLTMDSDPELFDRCLHEEPRLFVSDVGDFTERAAESLNSFGEIFLIFCFYWLHIIDVRTDTCIHAHTHMPSPPLTLFQLSI
jgi:hypothetical protein